MKHLIGILSLLLTLLHFTTAGAYQLPECEIRGDEYAIPAEDILASYESRIDEIARKVNIRKLNEYDRNSKLRLNGNERKAIDRYRRLKIPIRFWIYIVDLKRSILNLADDRGDPVSIDEADRMAKIIIDTIYMVSQKYRISTSALINNFLINIGARKDGRCYQYVTELMKALSMKSWQRFDLHWGTAYEGTFRENNALVITARNGSFNEGVAIDSWRTAGKPFWKPVKGDRFPWKIPRIKR